MAMSDRQPEVLESNPKNPQPMKMGPVNSEAPQKQPSTEGDDRKPKLLSDE